MATREQLQARLREAENAYHALMIGGSARVVVDQNGERAEFTAASATQLQKYIFYLKQMLGAAPPRAPAGVIF
ncbi:MAG: hypothetical protein DDT26_00284 [Dehalococcoidia bacterium]|nr:hypothetical protein [Chloroflexota bacterium]